MRKVKRIMVQGTMSGAGKSLLCAALCRIFRQDGLRVAPFKSQNMALNSFVTADGREMGRAQVMQAEAAGVEPDVRMNPILLKPTGETGSQVIVNGLARGQSSAAEYFHQRQSLIPDILSAWEGLAAEYDVIVIEGAGSPAEINLRENDIVNMGLAELVDAPVLLAGDIDRGGVFAQLYGTVALLEEKERRRVRGLVVNKFRGDVSLLTPGLRRLEDLTGVPVLGVVPWIRVELDEEDSMAPALTRRAHGKALDAAVIRLPHISNFTDFTPLERQALMGVRYVERSGDLGRPDLLILPGTKSTLSDLLWLRRQELEGPILALAREGVPVLGVCGGYQMLGQTLLDPEQTEGGPERLAGLGLLPCETRFGPVKTLTRREAAICGGPLEGAPIQGYEIHAGATVVRGEPFARFPDGTGEGCRRGNVCGTYLHGLFDRGETVDRLAAVLCQRKGLNPEGERVENARAYRERQYEVLASAVRQALDMDAIYRILEEQER